MPQPTGRPPPRSRRPPLKAVPTLSFFLRLPSTPDEPVTKMTSDHERDIGTLVPSTTSHTVAHAPPPISTGASLPIAEAAGAIRGIPDGVISETRGPSPSDSVAKSSEEEEEKRQSGSDAEAEDKHDGHAAVNVSDDDTSSEYDQFVKVGPRELFRFATKFDLLLNFIGLVAAAAAGAAQPLMTIVFGSLTSEFLIYQNDVVLGTEISQAKAHLKDSIAHNALLLGELLPFFDWLDYDYLLTS